MSFISNAKECINCGSDHKGKPFTIYADGCHCFSCGYHQSFDRSFTIAAKQQPKIAQIPDIDYNPANFTLENTSWLTKYYMTPQLVRAHSIGQCPLGSIVMPFVVEGNVVCWQQRWVKERRFKTGGAKVPAHKYTGSKEVVLVEDFISYCRVSAIVDCVCLYGTSLKDDTAEYLFCKYSKIIVWLDNDENKKQNSGQIAAKKICKKFGYILSCKQRQFGFGGVSFPTVVNIATDLDPKCYSPTELRGILCVENKATKSY